MHNEATRASWVRWGVLGKGSDHMKNFDPEVLPYHSVLKEKPFRQDLTFRRANEEERTHKPSQSQGQIIPPPAPGLTMESEL